MADIELVIKIPEDTYKDIIDNGFIYDEDNEVVIDVIKNGTPIYKGHGRISDMDEAIECIKETEGDDAIWAISLIEWACGKRTIIEADKGSEDKE